MLDRLVIKIEERKTGMICQIRILHKILNFLGRAVPQIEDARLFTRFPETLGLFTKPAGQVFDAIAVSFRRRVFEKADINDFSEKRSPFVGFAKDHIHHFIITSVAERLVISAVNKRGTEHEGMENLRAKAR